MSQSPNINRRPPYHLLLHLFWNPKKVQIISYFSLFVFPCVHFYCICIRIIIFQILWYIKNTSLKKISSSLASFEYNSETWDYNYYTTRYMQNKKEKMTYMNIIIILLLLPRIVVYCLIRKRKLIFSKKTRQIIFLLFFVWKFMKPKKYDLMFNFEKKSFRWEDTSVLNSFFRK